MAVAQVPFEANYNRFCKLVPLLYRDGTPVNPDDFPNDGEIWWMLTMTSAYLAEPGRLVVGRYEPSVRYDENSSASSYYQVVREDVRSLDTRIAIEIVDVPGDVINKIQDVVSASFTVGMNHPPSPQVMLRWRGDLFGPFSSSVSAYGAGGQLAISVRPSDPQMMVFHVEEEQFQRVAGDGVKALSCEVSLSPSRRDESSWLNHVTYELLLDRGYERMLAQNPSRLALEPLEAKLVRFARLQGLKRKRRELQALLEELEITGQTIEDAHDLLAAVAEAKGTLQAQDAALEAVTRALLETDVFGEDRIRAALAAFEHEYVQERTLLLQAEIDKRAASKREDLQRIEQQLSDLSTRLQEEEEQYRRTFRAELSVEREQFEQYIAQQTKHLDQQRTELEQQQVVLREQLGKVTQEWRESAEAVVQRYLSIAPLVEQAVASGAPSSTASNPRDHAGQQPPPMNFQLPAFIARAARGGEGPLAEEAFFERFQNVVEESGFDYRKIDLIRFHLSVKVGALTVLGGPSGIGKSSLPVLYGRALAGEELRDGRPGCLMVSVSPSWMDVRDLLGHWNPVEGRFYPAESGLFQHLVFAQEEYVAHGAGTAIYLTCLDEMNLSQVEYYFSDLMMVLEREGDQRVIQPFSDAGAAPNDPFRRWSMLRLSPALRFVGTVNYDETTRLLSDRLLDRSNVVQLRAGAFPTVTLRTGADAARVQGRAVTLADFESWLTGDPLAPDLVALLDEIRPLLQEIGTPISPRVYRAIHQFVSASRRLLPPDKAFDLQLAQRIVPKIRNVVTRRQLDALDAFIRALGRSSLGAFDETKVLLEDLREKAAGRELVLDD